MLDRTLGSTSVRDAAVDSIVRGKDMVISNLLHQNEAKSERIKQLEAESTSLKV